MNKVTKISLRFIGYVFQACRSLIDGMRVTFYYLVRPGTVVTQQYPENRDELKMFDRFRAQLTMVHDQNGYHKCTACQFCEQACPNGSIKVLFREKPAIAKVELDALLWRLDSCTFCNACVVVCPFQVLKFEPKFESSVYDRRLLVYNMSQYAGPPASALTKIEDPEVRRNAIEPRAPYYGPIPMAGKEMAGVEAVCTKKDPDGSSNK